jgi:hypothetical protein
MKFFAIFTLIFSTQSVFAGGPGEPILSKRTSRGAVAPQHRESRMVEVFPMGGVQVTKIKGMKSSTSLVTTLEPETMKAIKACYKIVSKKAEVKYPNCAGGGSTVYRVAGKMVSIRTCGEVNTMRVACVKTMMNILDNL